MCLIGDSFRRIEQFSRAKANVDSRRIHLAVRDPDIYETQDFRIGRRWSNLPSLHHETPSNIVICRSTCGLCLR